MSLPKIDYPLTEITIPSSGKKSLFRPFTVKEEKILLLSNESEDLSDKLRAIRQIVNNCSESDIDVHKMPSFDLEYIFLKLRAFSVDNIVELNYVDPDDDSRQTFLIDLNDIEVETYPEHNNIVEAGKYKIKLRYPTIEDMSAYHKDENNDSIIDLIISCIDIMYDDDNAWKNSDYTRDEWRVLVESLSSKVLSDIGNFFKTSPKLSKTIKFKNAAGVEKEIVLQGIADFL